MFYLVREVEKIWTCSCWEKSKFKYCQTWKIWPSLLSLSIYSTLKSFLHRSYKKAKLLFSVTAVFNIFMRQTLSDDSWGLHKNMNCAFSLMYCLNYIIKNLFHNKDDIKLFQREKTVTRNIGKTCFTKRTFIHSKI